MRLAPVMERPPNCHRLVLSIKIQPRPHETPRSLSRDALESLPMPADGALTFGPFHLDSRTKRLRRNGVEVPLPIRLFDLLHTFATHAGETLSKDALIRAVWGAISVSDNSLVQAVAQLRAALDPSDLNLYIVTVFGQGYRFVAPVMWLDAHDAAEDLDALLAPHRSLMTGRAALETLEVDAIARARQVFAQLVLRHPRDASFHVGLANACVLLYESTRASATPDVELLKLAAAHAREACRLNPDYGEAWATRGFVLERLGLRVDALAALRRATSLEPDNWRHHLRMASASWGEERLRAARRALTLLPGCPIAHLLVATVYVARHALGEAEREVDLGIQSARAASPTLSRFSMVGLHWLKGLLCFARGADDEGLAACAEELALEARNHLYAHECCAHAWYAIGTCHARRGETAAARAAFGECIARIPSHAPASAARAMLDGDGPLREIPLGESAGWEDGEVPAVGITIEMAIAVAASYVEQGMGAVGAALVLSALDAEPHGNAGWLIPVEPWLGVSRDPAAWTAVLATLRNRAS